MCGEKGKVPYPTDIALDPQISKIVISRLYHLFRQSQGTNLVSNLENRLLF